MLQSISKTLVLNLGLLTGFGLQVVKAQNEFTGTSVNYSFDSESPFYWTDAQDTWLTGIHVKGNTDPNESLTLPCLFPFGFSSTLFLCHQASDKKKS